MYKIMFDYGSEGFKFYDSELEYTTVNEAVKVALGLSYSAPFIIVKVIDWKAEEVE